MPPPQQQQQQSQLIYCVITFRQVIKCLIIVFDIPDDVGCYCCCSCCCFCANTIWYSCFCCNSNDLNYKSFFPLAFKGYIRLALLRPAHCQRMRLFVLYNLQLISSEKGQTAEGVFVVFRLFFLFLKLSSCTRKVWNGRECLLAIHWIGMIIYVGTSKIHWNK